MAKTGPSPHYQVPSFELYRPITNFGADTMHGFEDAVYDLAEEAADADALQKVQFHFGDPDQLQVPLVSAEEILRVHEHYKMPLERAESKSLKDYIDKNQPLDLKGPAEIDAAPASVYWMFARGGRSAAVVSLGAGKQLLRDRREIKRTVQRSLEKPDSDTEISHAWPRRVPYRDGALVTVTGERRGVTAAVSVIDLAMRQAGVIPPLLEAGRVKQKGVVIYRKRH
jgi:hypothetical protein